MGHERGEDTTYCLRIKYIYTTKVEKYIYGMPSPYLPPSKKKNIYIHIIEYTPVGERPPVYYKLEKKN